MNKRNALFFALWFTAVSAWSQYVIKSEADLANLKQVPQEKVYVNHTGPVLFAGEYLYYSFQCFNTQNSRPSDVSKVGYIALIDENKNYVLEQKIKLEKGRGQGDFFVSTEMASGNYKLLGYTQWMKNNGLAQVFKDDLVIINPYFVDQSTFLKASDKDTIVTAAAETVQDMDASTVGLVLENTVFGTREKVNFSLKNYKGNLGFGTYSIKVTKKSEFAAKHKMDAVSFASDYLNVDKAINLTVGDSLFLPEQRGELLFGTVTDAVSGDRLPNTPVVVSLPGKEFVLKFATTDDEGNFYTYLRKDYKEARAVVQVEDEDKNANISLKLPRKLDVSDLEFGAFTFDEELAAVIEQRSVYNQIENQFFALKPDSVLLGDPIDPFDGGIPETLLLDDYTRFPTFQETLVEIVNNAGYRNNPDGNDYIRIAQDFESIDEAYNDFPAIVLVDGVYITNHEQLKDYDARNIKAISLIQDQFQLAGKQYQGLMAIETTNGDYYTEYSASNTLKSAIRKPLPKKNYYQQRYTSEADRFQRIPDYRSLLYWAPNIGLTGNSVDLEFFTSDVAGVFEITLDGFTTYGKPITLVQTITVEQ